MTDARQTRASGRMTAAADAAKPGVRMRTPVSEARIGHDSQDLASGGPGDALAKVQTVVFRRIIAPGRCSL